MVNGVSEGFERKLELVGVGYRAVDAGQGPEPVARLLAPGRCSRRRKASPSAPRPRPKSWSPGADKQRVGEVAAKIRGYRPPEPYKGKGVKYAGEVIIRKEAKKA